MELAYLIFVLVTWATGLFLALTVTAIIRYRASTVLREGWLFLAVILSVYTLAFASSSAYYAYMFAAFGGEFAVEGAKSIPGLSALFFAAALSTAFSFIASYLATGGEGTRAIKYTVLGDPALLALVIISWALCAYSALAPGEATYRRGPLGLTVVYSDTVHALVAVGLALWLRLAKLVFNGVKRCEGFAIIARPLRVLTLLSLSVLVAGFASMVIASKTLYDVYLFMNTYFFLASLALLPLVYSDLLSSHKLYTYTLISQLERPRPVAEAPEPEVSGTLLVRVEPEEDYGPVIKALVDRAAKRKSVVIVAPLNSPLLRQAYENSENVFKVALTVTGTLTPHPGVVPANNMPLIANTVVSMVKRLGEALVVFDGISDLVLVNDVRSVYVMLRHVIELLPRTPLLAIVNWKALSEREYSALAALFDKVCVLKGGGLVAVRSSQLLS